MLSVKLWAQLPFAGVPKTVQAFALAVFLRGEMRSGIDVVLDLIDFDARLKDVDLVVTGEGQTDWQSCFGKVMQGVGMRSDEMARNAILMRPFDNEFLIQNDTTAVLVDSVNFSGPRVKKW